MLLRTLLIYFWHVFVLKTIERWIRNFIWVGEIDKRKMVIVAWHKCCRHFDEGGLAIRSLLTLNEASNLKRCWDMTNSKDQWAALIRQRVMRDDKHINYAIYSSLWSSMKGSFGDVKENSTWVFGNGRSIKFCLDN